MQPGPNGIPNMAEDRAKNLFRARFGRARPRNEHLRLDAALLQSTVHPGGNQCCPA